MQQDILARHPDADLRVYAVWTAKLFGDARERWDGAGLTDPRVVHLWDERNLTGQWAVKDLAGYDGPDWDTYLLFGPDARWTAEPPELLGSGFTVVDEGEQLARSLQRLIG